MVKKRCGVKVDDHPAPQIGHVSCPFLLGVPISGSQMNIVRLERQPTGGDVHSFYFGNADDLFPFGVLYTWMFPNPQDELTKPCLAI